MSPSEKAQRLRLIKARHKVIQGRPVRSLVHVHQNEMRRKWASARMPVELAPMRISYGVSSSLLASDARREAGLPVAVQPALFTSDVSSATQPGCDRRAPRRFR